MNLKCFFSHQWSGCKCERCDKVRDMKHKWDSCKCTMCGKMRDENHDLNLCVGKCNKCGKPNNIEHDWDGCKCKRCSKTRDEAHDWDGCKCKRCSETRNEAHDWDGCKCRKCIMENHDWDDCICKNCGKKNTGYKVHHNFQPVSGKCVEVCSVCGQESYSECHTYQLVPNKCTEECTVCEKTQKIKHSYNNSKCTRCAADINAAEDHGIPPLIWAALNGNVEEVKSLLKGGANVDIYTDETPLIAAARKGYDAKHTEIVKLLLAHGAKVNATDLYGSSALRLAQRKGLTEMVTLLAAHGGKYLGA